MTDFTNYEEENENELTGDQETIGFSTPVQKMTAQDLSLIDSNGTLPGNSSNDICSGDLICSGEQHPIKKPV